MQLPSRRSNRLDFLDQPHRAARPVARRQFEAFDPAHTEAHRIARRIARSRALACPEPPLRVAGEQHDPVGIGDEHAVLGVLPLALEPVELDLDRDHTKRAICRADPLGKIKTRAAADGAEREFGAGAFPQGTREIFAEAVIRSDEAVRPVPVARRQRQSARVHQIDRCGIGLIGQRGETAVEQVALARVA